MSLAMYHNDVMRDRNKETYLKDFRDDWLPDTIKFFGQWATLSNCCDINGRLTYLCCRNGDYLLFPTGLFLSAPHKSWSKTEADFRIALRQVNMISPCVDLPNSVMEDFKRVKINPGDTTPLFRKRK